MHENQVGQNKDVQEQRKYALELDFQNVDENLKGTNSCICKITRDCMHMEVIKV